MLTVAEWRKNILQFFRSFGNGFYACEKEKVFGNFGSHIDSNTYAAFDSLIKDKRIIEVEVKDKLFYLCNLQKITEIESEIYSSLQNYTPVEIIQPFEKKFSQDLVYVFESETDRQIPNKGKYLHFVKKDDKTYWISVVRTKGGKSSRNLVLGSLNNPKSRISRIYKAIIKQSKETGQDTFIKKNIEDREPHACGNTRQYSRASLDILKHLELITEISSKGKSPIYTLINNEYPYNKSSKNNTLDIYLKETVELNHTKNKL